MMELFEDDPDGPDLTALVEEFGAFMGAEDRRNLLRGDRKRVAAQMTAEIRRRQADA